LELFAEKIGAVGAYKQSRLQEMCEYLAEHPANTNRDVIPHDVWRMYAVPAMQQAGMTSRQLQSSLGNAYCGTALYKQNMSRERAARLAEVVHSDVLRAFAESDVYWDRIETILPDGEEPVFDLTVPAHQNFVANNMIVHNSLEQDADIVMFIYRDEKDPSMANVTHLKIAKHRNGPVGQVDLIFRNNLTKFENAATRKVDLSAG